jgi:hypothetical protein
MEWINCKKEQPKEFGEYIVAWKVDDGDPLVKVLDWNAIDNRWQDININRTHEITHWMPLPEPPKTASEGVE